MARELFSAWKVYGLRYTSILGRILASRPLNCDWELVGSVGEKEVIKKDTNLSHILIAQSECNLCHAFFLGKNI